MLSLALVLAFLVILLSCFQLTRSICKLVHKGNSTDLLLIGTLLTSTGALFNMHILIQRGLITYVGNGRHLTHNAVFLPTSLYAGSETIELVVHGEKVILAGAGLERLTRGDCEKVAFGEAEKTVCVEDEIGMSFAQLEKRLGGVYPAVLAGKPKNEPTCEPTR